MKFPPQQTNAVNLDGLFEKFQYLITKNTETVGRLNSLDLDENQIFNISTWEAVYNRVNIYLNQQL